MEQTRLVIAIVLSVLILLVWDFFFKPEMPRAPVPEQTAQEEKVVHPPSEPLREALPPAKKPVEDDGDKMTEVTTVVEEPPSPPIFIETPLYSAVLSGREMCFTAFNLKHYKADNSDASPNKQLISEKNDRGTGCVNFELTAVPDNKTSRFYPDAGVSGTVEVAGSARTLSFKSHVNEFVSITKRYTFLPDTYTVGLDITVENRSAEPFGGVLGVSLNRNFSEKESRFVFEGPCTYIGGKLEEVKLKKIEETPSIPGPLSWVAIQTRYFMTAVIPEQPDEAVMALKHGEDGLVSVQYRQNMASLSPQAKSTYHYTLYMGPKDISVLKSVGSDLDRAVNFGWFDVVARPCLWLMKQIYRIIPNYGISIMLVTLIIKLLFWPLGTKSYKSMGEMKKIQPLMAEIREKYKNDKQKMNQEMMGLYKTYKVNPLGGCLPMVIQIPVFIAFYRMLYQAIELRHAHFFMWINDLSAPERLFSFDFTIPLMQPPTGIPVLTIIMGATMFLQQKMQPSPGDPAQAKMMLLMPIFLTVIFINFPSGLVLYFIVNNLFSIFQQQYVTREKS